MSAARLQLDFAADRRRIGWIGVALLVLGVASAAAAGFEYRALEGRRAGLELRLARSTRGTSTRSEQSSTRDAHKVAGELGTPWTGLLSELEAASHDSDGQIAVLSIEPDHEKHRVHVSGEARSLPLTLAYLQRLQTARSLRHPMLESHEVKVDDSERPVRFVLSAEWRDAP